jgi:hypothetical protein
MFAIVVLSCAIIWGEVCPIDRVELLAVEPSASLCAPEIQAAALLMWSEANTERRAAIVACLPGEQVPEMIARLMLPH